jgi:1-acyl-sn-glycerol-3-phosphate acyltransferase
MPSRRGVCGCRFLKTRLGKERQRDNYMLPLRELAPQNVARGMVRGTIGRLVENDAVKRAGSILAHWLRVVAYFAAMLIVCLYCEVVGRVWSLWLAKAGTPARVRRANRITRHWNVVLTELTMRMLRARLDVHGELPNGRFLVVSNHQSMADVAILPWALRSLNLKFVAKEALGRYIPTISMALTHWGSALISREGSRRDFARLKAMARNLSYWDGSVVVFPEGTRSRDGRLLPYKAAAVRIVAEESGLPILPVVIDGTHAVSDLSGFARRMIGARGTLTIGAPIPPDAWNGRIEEVVMEIRVWAADCLQAGRGDDSQHRMSFERLDQQQRKYRGVDAGYDEDRTASSGH